MAKTIEELQQIKDQALQGSEQLASVDTTTTELDNYAAYQQDQCADVERVEEDPIVCPTCTPNPAAVVPNWKQLPVRTPIYLTPEDLTPLARASDGFLNERTCEYSIVVTSDYEGTGGSDEILEERQNEVLEPAIRLRVMVRVEPSRA